MALDKVTGPLSDLEHLKLELKMQKDQIEYYRKVIGELNLKIDQLEEG